jgi:phosphoribosyl 1,2-cyclic phosphate phosphodiesterase
MDDLRPLSFVAAKRSGPIPLYATPDTTAILERVFDYTFSPDATYPNRARVELRPVAAHNNVFGADFIRVPVMHGDLEISGYRFGSAAYLTDVSAIPESSVELLAGLDVLVLSALRHVPHPSHATVAQALEWAQKIGAKQTWFTHISHDLGHDETNGMLPSNVQLAWDGLSVPVTL